MRTVPISSQRTLLHPWTTLIWLIIRRIGDSNDEFERMLAVLRFSFSKELKFVRARLGKPYNSALGESQPPLLSLTST